MLKISPLTGLHLKLGKCQKVADLAERAWGFDAQPVSNELISSRFRGLSGDLRCSVKEPVTTQAKRNPEQYWVLWCKTKLWVFRILLPYLWIIF